MHRLLVKDDDIELGEEKEERMLQIKERDQYLEHQTLGQRVVCPTDLVTQWIYIEDGRIYKHRARFFQKCIIVHRRLLVKDDDIELKPVYYTGVVHNLDLQEKTT